MTCNSTLMQYTDTMAENDIIDVIDIFKNENYFLHSF